MSEMLLVVMLGGRRAALPAHAVNCVIELAAITPVPLAAPHVAGLAALRSRPLTLIDCAVVVGVTAAPMPGCGRRAVVVEHDGHLYGLLVDAADDIVAALDDAGPIGADAGPGWHAVAAGRIESEAGALLLLDIAALVAGPAERQAA
jgi:purine-binding chemotaxis protein CheW